MRSVAKKLRSTLKVMTILVLSAVLAPAVFAATALATLLYVQLPATLPQPKDLHKDFRPTVVVDRNGNEIATFKSFETTKTIHQQDIPQSLKDALVSSEDRNFYTHTGFDVRGAARALWTDLRRGERAQGGSTITQQYVKLAYVGNKRTVWRKIQEVVIARQVDRKFSKDEIMFKYLDAAYFGDGAYGIGGAAETFFHKDVANLDISESAMLVGALPSPSFYAPRTNLALAESRRKLVLSLMKQEGKITQAQYDQEVLRVLWMYNPAEQQPQYATVVYPASDGVNVSEPGYWYFIDLVRKYLAEEFGDKLFTGGLRIETTLDPQMQHAADEVASSVISPARAAGGDQTRAKNADLEMSIVTVEPGTGYVLAVHGGQDWNAQGGQVNLALGKAYQNGSLGFQPGSTWKVFVLAAALERGLTPETTYPAPSEWKMPGCTPVPADDCMIHNYANAGFGELSIEQATLKSANTVYAQMARDVGVETIYKMAEKLGVSWALDKNADYAAMPGLRSALGVTEVSPLEMASAFSVFADKGLRAEPTPVYRVLDSDGKVLLDNSTPKQDKVIEPLIADTVNAILKQNVIQGTGTRAQIGRDAAGKTGTTNDNMAAWFVGYTPNAATAVWMGHRDSLVELTNINGVSRVDGGTIPAATWGRYMKKALEGKPAPTFDNFDSDLPLGDILNERARGGINLNEPGVIQPAPGCNPCKNELEAPPAYVPVVTTTTTTTTTLFDPFENSLFEGFTTSTSTNGPPNTRFNVPTPQNG